MNKELQKKLERFCAYQERCKQDVLRKVAALRQAGAHGGNSGCESSATRRGNASATDFTDKDVIEIIEYLEDEKFIDESRFARIYAISKLRQKQWGKYKINAHLKAKNISAENIQQALETLDPKEYEAIHKKILETKGEQTAFAHGF